MNCIVPAALNGQRLDRAISTLTGLPRTIVKSLLEMGAVSCNGELSSTPSKHVATGAEIEINSTQLDAVNAARNTIAPPAHSSNIEFAVMYEDEQVVVVNKPAGLVTHPGAGHLDDTLLNGLLSRYPEMADVGATQRPGIVHRLDRDTSGLLVCARTEAALEHLLAQMAQRQVVREYVALVRGTPAAKRGTIDAPIARSHRVRTRMQIRPDGREARTDYTVLGSVECLKLTPPVASLVSCALQTGRTHQIRVHLASIALPVLGDPTYGCPDPFGINRQLLHAAKLAFTHPATGETVAFVAPPPTDLEVAAQTLGLGEELAAALAAPPGVPADAPTAALADAPAAAPTAAPAESPNQP